ncbi:MAG TPA: response regulator transcription factor [Anaeromyxobacteraceae bacterium]
MPSREVLVVEDEPDLAALLEMLLVGAGYAVRTAGDGAQALLRVAERMPSLVLLDMCMPIMNGWEFAGEFAARYGRAAPVVVVTAEVDARVCALEIGAVAWLQKPFGLEHFLATVARLLVAPYPLGRAQLHAP